MSSCGDGEIVASVIGAVLPEESGWVLQNETDASTSAFLLQLSTRLADDDVKKLALGLLAKLLEADHQAAESEAAFYQKAQSVFGV